MSGPIACVIGWPVAHSRSPIIHKFWLDQLGLDGDYRHQAVEPSRIEGFLRGLADSHYVGANVTVPHKEAAFAVVPHLDAAATAIGAVNTIWIEDGGLMGANTDPTGFLANLDEAAPGWDARADTAVLLGAGGAARGLAWGLASRHFGRVLVANRTLARGRQLAADLGAPVEAVAWNQIDDVLGAASLVVNATTQGMVGQPPLAIALDRLPNHAVVSDIVYTPLETPLLAAARSRGLRAGDGLGMLLHQAVPGFEHWFGAKPAVTPGLRSAVLATLEPRALSTKSEPF